MSKFLAILKIAGPGLLIAAGVPPVIVPFVVKGMEIAEQSQQPGATKKATVMASVSTAAAAFEALGHYPGLTAAVDKGIDATIATINVFAKQEVAPATTPEPPPQ